MNQKLRFLCFRGIHIILPSFWAKLGYSLIKIDHIADSTKTPDWNWSASYKCWTVATPYSGRKERTKKSSPKHNESDSEADEERETKRGKYDDFVEIVCVVKPRHERTPEIIDLSSEEIEVGSDDQNWRGFFYLSHRLY